MAHSDIVSDSPTDADAAVDSAPAAPDVMARILEPRVRSNAKNNPKTAKSALPKIPAATPTAGSQPRASSAPVTESAEPSNAENAELSQNLLELREMVAALQESHTSRDRAFDLLYEELGGYKNDFYLERLKPSLRALLFLLDSIEGFEQEIAGLEERGEAITGELVKANLIHFRDQLTDVLTLSEMTPIEHGDDKFDPKTQRAVHVVPVEPEHNNTVQRQIRGGWKLGDKMLRPADVVVGRSK